ncbi:MAG TPA: FmdB family transcriptional regulator [Anaerolineaceae bacterium]|uniref:Putative regulatory protein, FmdB family n=1 Tax=Anaerolinea thermophila TaxID=167964 RepID=A0A101FY57_9CHLR|nr:MAG: putative regulatory protein, FmdB family [Anaerolinea thermophila]HAF62901.1 FmdB family transcriptional regulator [Anaerolineaceae bacterium]
MPVYVYHCDNCGIQFEKNQKFSDEPLNTCPDCGKKTLHKVITAPVSVIYKGSGFYSTDHRSNSGATSSARNTKESTEKTDAVEKPAAKSTETTEKSEA